MFVPTIEVEVADLKDATKRIQAYRDLFNIANDREVLIYVKGTFKDRNGEIIFLNSYALVDNITTRLVSWFDKYNDCFIPITPIDPIFSMRLAV